MNFSEECTLFSLKSPVSCFLSNFPSRSEERTVPLKGKFCLVAALPSFFYPSHSLSVTVGRKACSLLFSAALSLLSAFLPALSLSLSLFVRFSLIFVSAQRIGRKGRVNLLSGSHHRLDEAKITVVTVGDRSNING